MMTDQEYCAFRKAGRMANAVADLLGAPVAMVGPRIEALRTAWEAYEGAVIDCLDDDRRNDDCNEREAK